MDVCTSSVSGKGPLASMIQAAAMAGVPGLRWNTGIELCRSCFRASVTWFLAATYIAAKSMGLEVNVGSILSSDSFYNDHPEHWHKWAEYGVLGVEMETSVLYTVAAKHQVEALSILTVSDSLVTGKVATVEERQNNFDDMAKIALHLI